MKGLECFQKEEEIVLKVLEHHVGLIDIRKKEQWQFGTEMERNWRKVNW